MIRGYSDHAANERMFSLVRTGIAVIAFRIIIEISIYLYSQWQVRARPMRDTDCTSKGYRGRLAVTTDSLSSFSDRR